MISFLPYIYIVRDKKYSDESADLIKKIENLTSCDSAFGYFACGETIHLLSDLLKKNNAEYSKCYKVNFLAFNNLKEIIGWELIKPFTDFESEIDGLFKDIEELLEEKSYYVNSQSKSKLLSAEKIIQDYIDNSHLVDKKLRVEFHSKLNQIKKNLLSDSLISVLIRSNDLIALEEIFTKNEENFQKYYKVILERFEPVKQSFARLKPYFSNKEAYSIEEQFDNVEYILQSQDFDSFEEAEEILNMAEFKLTEIVGEKRLVISNNLKKELNKLKTFVWIEDWIVLKGKMEELIEESNRTGHLDKLNFDSFGIEHKKAEKKEMIYDFIKTLENSEGQLVKAVLDELKGFFDKEKSRKDLEELQSRMLMIESEGKANGCTDPKQYSKLLRYLKFVSVIVLLALSMSAFFINQKKNAVHFSAKGQKYADIVETMIYAQKKNNEEINIDKIRRKISVSSDELKIISFDNEVVIEYRNKIYKKNIRKK
ncbi:TPA: hypothetical protein DCR49_01375 [Candidatus Delongbacteria bacterium]|nr:hypothetical protein [Candidatus Delongbacteria bacterium]